MEHIDEWIQEQDFWKPEAEEQVRIAWQRLVGCGFSDEKATEIIGDIWSAAVNEFGG